MLLHLFLKKYVKKQQKKDFFLTKEVFFINQAVLRLYLQTHIFLKGNSKWRWLTYSSSEDHFLNVTIEIGVGSVSSQSIFRFIITPYFGSINKICHIF